MVSLVIESFVLNLNNNSLLLVTVLVIRLLYRLSDIPTLLTHTLRPLFKSNLVKATSSRYTVSLLLSRLISRLLCVDYFLL